MRRSPCQPPVWTVRQDFGHHAGHSLDIEEDEGRLPLALGCATGAWNCWWRSTRGQDKETLKIKFPDL